MWPGPIATFFPPATSISARPLSVMTNCRLGPTCQSLTGAGALRLNSTPVAFIISLTLPLSFISISSAWLRPSAPV